MVHAYNGDVVMFRYLIGFMAFLSFTPTASGVPGDCVPLNSSYDFKDSFFASERNYRRNATTFPIAGISGDEVDSAIKHGFGIWNDQSSAGSFTAEGYSSLTDLPHWDYQCANMGIDYSLAVIQNNGAPGSYWSRCRESTSGDPEFNKGTRAVWNAYRNNGGGTPRDWGVGDIVAGGFDLVQNFAHEAGHTIGLGHPANGEKGIMSGLVVGADYQRDLYQYELKCADEAGGFR